MEKNSSTQPSRHVGSKPLATWALATLIAIATAGCGGLLKVGYRNGETAALYVMNKYLDLSSEQKDFVKPRLRALLAWHKATQLPDYATLGIELQQKAVQPMTAAEVASLSEQAKRRVYTTINHAMPDMADITLRLTADNIRTLEAKFAEDDDKWRDENLDGDGARQQKMRYEKTLERVEEWYGRFSREQRARIRQFSDARPLANDALFTERQRREQEIVALLTRIEHDRPSRDAVVAMMKSYADRFDQSPDPERRAAIDALRRATDEMNAQIHDLATPQQRVKAVAKLQEYIDDFRSLAADPG